MKKVALVTSGLVAGLWLVTLAWPEKAYAPYDLPANYIEVADQWRSRNFSELPANWQWGEHKAADGVILRWGMAGPAGQPKATILFVPGYNGFQEVYAENYNILLDRGYKVIGLDQRGHGGSARMLKNPEKHWVSNFTVYTDDLAGFIEAVQSEVEGPLILMGESFGGHVSLRAVGNYSLDVDGLVLMVPALRINTGSVPHMLVRSIVEMSRLLGFSKNYAMEQGNWQPWQPDLTLSNPCGTDPSRVHTKDVFVAANPAFRGGGPTNQWLGEIMASGDLVTRKSYLAKITLPVVIATADEDVIVSSRAAEKACEEGLPSCTLLRLENTRHCVSYERMQVRMQIFDAVDALVDSLPVS